MHLTSDVLFLSRFHITGRYLENDSEQVNLQSFYIAGMIRFRKLRVFFLFFWSRRILMISDHKSDFGLIRVGN